MDDSIQTDQPFDAERAVAIYRDVIAKRDAEATDLGKAEFQTIAKRLRASWKTWQGEDSLHEMAFGEPTRQQV